MCVLKESTQIKLVWIQPSSNLVGEREEGYDFSVREKKHSVLGKVNIKCLKISMDGRRSRETITKGIEYRR